MSSLVTVFDHIAAALEQDAMLSAVTGATEDDGRVYDGLAPDGMAPPYHTIAGGRESRRSVYGAVGYEDVLMVRSWVPGPSHRAAAALAAHPERILHGAALPLDGHTALLCRVRLLDTQTDPDNAATQAISEVRVRTRRTG